MAEGRLPAFFVEKFKPRANWSVYDVPLVDLTRDELLAVIGVLTPPGLKDLRMEHERPT